MLKQNTTIYAQYPFRLIGGAGVERTMWDQTERRNKFLGEASFDKKCGVPSGHLAPSSWNLPQSSGGMSAFTSINGTGVANASGALGLNGSASLSGAGDITSATAQLVISMVATLAGSSTLSTADLRGYLNAVANLSGGGTLTAAIGALAWANAALSGTGTISNATPYATGTLSANIRGYSDLTPEGITDKVWNAVAANYTTTGTMGQKLNSAASGGVDYNALAAAVWQYVIESGISAEQAMRIYGAVLAGKVSGAGTGTEVFTGMDGTTVRVTSTVDASGNRTAVTVDGA